MARYDFERARSLAIAISSTATRAAGGCNRLPRRLILHGALPALRHVPQDAAGIVDVGDAKAPGLHRRRLRVLHAEPGRKIERVEMRPPCVQVVDHELHHAVLGPLLLITALEDEAAGAGVED